MVGRLQIYFTYFFVGVPVGIVLWRVFGLSPDWSMGIGLVLAIFLTPYLMIRLGGGR